MEFDLDMLHLAYQTAMTESHDLSTNNGAVLVNPHRAILAIGANTLPDGIAKIPARLARPLKYECTVHAERQVIYQAAKNGLATEGATLYVPWFACGPCAGAIIQAGIKRVVGHRQMFDKTAQHPAWVASVQVGIDMLEEARVELDFLDTQFDDIEILFNGHKWRP